MVFSLCTNLQMCRRTGYRYLKQQTLFHFYDIYYLSNASQFFSYYFHGLQALRKVLHKNFKILDLLGIEYNGNRLLA